MLSKIKRSLFLLLLLLFPSLTCAQSNQLQVPVIIGPSGAPRAGATITVCNFPATGGVPCTNYASIFSDAALSQAITQPGQLKTDGLGNCCVISASSVTVFAAPGTYAYTVSGTGIAAPQGPYTLTIPVPNTANPWIDVTDPAYGAKCDGLTDDSVALQAALTAAANNGFVMRLPPKICRYGTGLTSTKSVAIEGAEEQGGITPNTAPTSILQYTGTGTAISVRNGTNFIYGSHFKRFELVAVNAANQGTGIDCSYCNQTTFEDVFVVAIPTIGFATGVNLSNSALIFTWNFTVSNTGTAVNLLSATNIVIDTCDLYQATIGFLLGENASGIANIGIQIHHCGNIERVNRVMVVDDTNPSSTINVSEQVNFSHNYVIFDGGNTWVPNAQVLYMNNTGTNQLTADTWTFADNEIYCSAGANQCTSSTYPFQINISGTSPASTHVTATMERNFIFNFASGGVTANSSKASVVWMNNQNLTAALNPNTDTNGTGNFAVMKYQGALWFVPPLQNTTSTFALLGSVPAAGVSKYCTDCTTAATCAGGGSGHMAVSNGTNWTCQ